MLERNGLEYIASHYIFNANWKILLDEYEHIHSVSAELEHRFAEALEAGHRAKSSAETDHALQLLIETLTSSDRPSSQHG